MAKTQKTELMQAHNEWATRPDDERYLDLPSMAKMMKRVREESTEHPVNLGQELRASSGKKRGEQLSLVYQDQPFLGTHWGFEQLCGIIGAPAHYLRDLPAELSADLLNHHLADKKDDAVKHKLLLTGPRDKQGRITTDGWLRATTGKDYGRIWNHEVVDDLIGRFGDGVTGDFRVPGIFGKKLDAVTKENTTLFASDRDMFVFLADEENRIAMPGRRAGDKKNGDGLARGFFVGNSEVGARTLYCAFFLFDYVCCNRIVWGVEEFRELRIRHSSAAPGRWLTEAQKAISEMADASDKPIRDAIANARSHVIGKARDEVHAWLIGKAEFTVPLAKAVMLAHEEAEQRPIETRWDAVVGLTEHAKLVKWQDARVKLERQAGELLALTA